MALRGLNRGDSRKSMSKPPIIQFRTATIRVLKSAEAPSQEDPDGGSHQGVGGALEDEHHHQVAPLGPNRAGHAHLGPAGRRQHHKDEEYQQYADQYGEERHHHEQGRGYTTRNVGELEDQPFNVEDAELGQVFEQGVGLALEVPQIRLAKGIQDLAGYISV